MSLIDDAPNKHGFPKNPVLERAMDEIARNDNAETRESLYKAMLATTFIAQGSISGSTVASDGKWIADSSTRVAFRTVEHPPGNIVLPVFTDAEALISWASAEVQWIAMPAQQLFQSIVPSNIAEVRVNPFKPGQTINRPGGVITRNEFVALTQGLLPESRIAENTTQMRVAAGQQLFIGAPSKELPADLLKKLSDYFLQIPELRGAYLFQMTNQGVTSSVIGLQFDADPNAQRMEQVMGGIGQVVRGAIPAEMSIDFMPLTAGPFLASVQKCGKALLEK
jgi:hypothetical protein